MNTFLSDGVLCKLLYKNYREKNSQKNGVLCKLLYKNYREKNSQKSKDDFNVSNSTSFEIY